MLLGVGYVWLRGGFVVLGGAGAPATAPCGKTPRARRPRRVCRTPAFYVAEPYHQNYYQTHGVQHRYYRWNCGRDARLEQIREAGRSGG